MKHELPCYVTVVCVAIVILLMMVSGCQRGDMSVSPVIAGQPAPHNGYNVGPELYVEQGQPVPVSGLLIRIAGLDPNDLMN